MSQQNHTHTHSHTGIETEWTNGYVVQSPDKRIIIMIILGYSQQD